MVTFTEEILNGKLHFLCSVGKKNSQYGCVVQIQIILGYLPHQGNDLRCFGQFNDEICKEKVPTQGIRTIKKLSPSAKSGTANKFTFHKTQEVMLNDEITQTK